MKLLLRSDTQADLHNLDLVKISLKETLKWAEQYQVDAIIDAGDLKEAYSPVHIQVVKLWVWFVRECVKRKLRFIALLGNHDRISQSSESKNWLDILQAAGAEIVTKPRVKQVGNANVAFLPFTADKKQEVEWAQQLLKDSEQVTAIPESTVGVTLPCILIFHTDVLGAKVAGSLLSKGNSEEALGMDQYEACFGGHLHQYQRLYIGSPFCHDWSEANQTKGQLVVELRGRKLKVIRCRTSIPGWYDTQWLESKGLEPEAGAYIRSRVPVTSKQITQQLRDEEERIRNAFPASKDLRLFVVPKLVPEKDQEIKLEGTDEDVVGQYVAATWPEGMVSVAKQAVSYISSLLSKVAPAARGKALRFISLEGENILSFAKVKVTYSKQGLVVVRGKNLDWPKHSNGSGKTNLLSLLYVVLFGENLKGQKADAWANEHTDGRAWGRLVLRDERNRKIVVERERPHSIKLWVNGKDESTGIRGTGRAETQGRINAITGFDKDLLSNAVYIDQTVANGLVFGSKSGRLDLLNKIQNLERYDAALKLVGKDIDRVIKAKQDVESTIERVTSDLAHHESILSDLQDQTKTDWEQRRKVAQKEVARLISIHAGLAGSKATYEQAQEELDSLKWELKAFEDKQREIAAMLASNNRELTRAKSMLQDGKCVTCGQPAEKIGEELLAATKKANKELAESDTTVRQSIQTKEKEIKKRLVAITNYESGVDRIEQQLEAARNVLNQASTGADEEAKRNAKLAGRKQEATTAVRRCNRTLKAAQESLRHYEASMELLVYSKKALHRSGIPLYLSSALCPVLNKAAEEYSEIFIGGELMVKFAIEDGEFIAVPVNPSGSATLLGQSEGESAWPGIIAACALREVAPKTNLLILDEPGHGLDPEGCKQFARGIVKLKERFETVILTTHSQVIESLLAGETQWTVTKQKRISSLIV